MKKYCYAYSPLSRISCKWCLIEKLCHIYTKINDLQLVLIYIQIVCNLFRDVWITYVWSIIKEPWKLEKLILYKLSGMFWLSYFSPYKIKGGGGGINCSPLCDFLSSGAVLETNLKRNLAKFFWSPYHNLLHAFWAINGWAGLVVAWGWHYFIY